jgi:hypothetical protein
MAKSTKKGGAKKAAKKPSKKTQAKGELKDEQVDAASGGAVDAFIWFNQPGTGTAPQGETKDTTAGTPNAVFIIPKL